MSTLRNTSLKYKQSCELSVCCVAGNPRQLTFSWKKGSSAEKNGKSIGFRRVCVVKMTFFFGRKKKANLKTVTPISHACKTVSSYADSLNICKYCSNHYKSAETVALSNTLCTI
jgi:hypothetical protein